MRDIDKRLERVERIIGDVHCVCGKHRHVCVLVEDGWTPENVELADKGAMFTCRPMGSACLRRSCT